MFSVLTFRTRRSRRPSANSNRRVIIEPKHLDIIGFAKLDTELQTLPDFLSIIYSASGYLSSCSRFHSYQLEACSSDGVGTWAATWNLFIILIWAEVLRWDVMSDVRSTALINSTIGYGFFFKTTSCIHTCIVIKHFSCLVCLLFLTVCLSKCSRLKCYFCVQRMAPFTSNAVIGCGVLDWRY